MEEKQYIGRGVITSPPKGKVYISGYKEQQADKFFNYHKYITGMQNLLHYLKKQEIISKPFYGNVEVMEIVGFIKNGSYLLEKFSGSRMVERDRDHRLGDFKIVRINHEDDESKRDFIIPSSEVIERWMFSIEVEFVIDLDYTNINTLKFNDGKYRLSYSEGELTENYGEEFWDFISAL